MSRGWRACSPACRSRCRDRPSTACAGRAWTRSGLPPGAIKAGECDLMIAGGVESMSRAPFVMGKAETAFSRAAEIHDTTIGWRFVNPRMKAEHGVDSMPETAENVADEFNISREDQDAFALRSQQRAARAIEAGRFDQEIVPVTIEKRKGATEVVGADEHPRPGTRLENLAKLKPIVRAGGTITAGNASGVNDGACAMILASKKAVTRHKLTPRARVIAMATAGVPAAHHGHWPGPGDTQGAGKDRSRPWPHRCDRAQRSVCLPGVGSSSSARACRRRRTCQSQWRRHCPLAIRWG